MRYKNPIISGFHPDPSICRVGEDFYLVTSTFEFFPGVPIFHSRNLVNWELINYCLTTDTQLPLYGCKPSRGIYAATIRYHDGTFFMVTTNVSDKGNFIVHTNDVKGQWSEPVWVKQRGIDPSLFWDDDGTCYFVSNGDDKGNRGIYLCKIDPFTGEMLTASTLISQGCGGRHCSGKHPEAPHVYKKDNWYYLMLAEGGTEYGHMETIQRSRNIWGPYEQGGPYQPMLTHRDEFRNPIYAGIQATGHADIIEDQNGRWWLVCLGIRPIGDMQKHHLGRETFLAPMTWTDDGWPVVGDNGRIGLEMDALLPGDKPVAVAHDFQDGFDNGQLDFNWNFVRNPERERYCLNNGVLTINGEDKGLSSEGGRPSMVCIRQPEFCITAEVDILGDFTQNQISGMTVFCNEYAHYDLIITRKEDGHYVCLRKKVCDIEVITDSHKIDYSGMLRLKIESNEKWYIFYYKDNGQWVELGRGMTVPLCKEAICVSFFTGVYIGLFSENGTVSFDSFALSCSPKTN